MRLVTDLGDFAALHRNVQQNCLTCDMCCDKAVIVSMGYHALATKACMIGHHTGHVTRAEDTATNQDSDAQAPPTLDPKHNTLSPTAPQFTCTIHSILQYTTMYHNIL